MPRLSALLVPAPESVAVEEVGRVRELYELRDSCAVEGVAVAVGALVEGGGLMSSFAYAVAIAIAVALSWDKVMRPVQRRRVDSDVAAHLIAKGWVRPDDVRDALYEHEGKEVFASIERLCERGWAMMNGTRPETRTIGITREGERDLGGD